MGMTDDESFDAKALALRPEQLESGRLAETGIAAAKREKRKKSFVLVPLEHLERIAKTPNDAAWKVYVHLLSLDWRYPGNVIRVGNVALKRLGVSPDAKVRALLKLERLGLIKVKKMLPRKSPEVIVLQ
jgi:hypothetical protein